MYNPSHPGETIWDAIEAEGWTVSDTPKQLGVARTTLSRVLNGRAGVPPRLALALERLGRSDGRHWVPVQAAYDSARARRAATRTTATHG